MGDSSPIGAPPCLAATRSKWSCPVGPSADFIVDSSQQHDPVGARLLLSTNGFRMCALVEAKQGGYPHLLKSSTGTKVVPLRPCERSGPRETDKRAATTRARSFHGLRNDQANNSTSPTGAVDR